MEITIKTNQILTNFTLAIVAFVLTFCLTTSLTRATSALILNNGRFAAQSKGLVSPKELEAFLAPLMTDLMEANHIPGGAIAVVKDGQLFFVQGYGYVDLERRIPATADTTVFRAGSVFKVFTWTAVMQLVEQGKNYGAALAGEIVAEVSGEPFEQYLARHILEPLGMSHSTFYQPLPPQLVQAVVVGYTIDAEGVPQAGSFKFILVRPAGALSTTATGTYFPFGAEFA